MKIIYKTTILTILATMFFFSCSTPKAYYVEFFYNIRIDDFDYRLNDTVKNGCIKVFDVKDSVLRFEGCYKNYEKTGVWKEYYSNGKISYKFRYKNGLYEGIQKSWYHTGHVRIIWLSRDGVVKRILRCYNPDGIKISFSDFEDWQY